MKAQPKNILIFVPFFTLGGAETQAFNIALGFKQQGYNVSVLGFETKNGKLKAKLEESEIKWALLDFDLSSIHLKGLGKFLSLFKLILQIRNYKPDYLLPFTFYPNVLVSSIWKFTGAQKCFWNQRGYERSGVGSIEKMAVFQKPEYLSNSEGLAAFITQRHQLTAGKVKVIRNGLLSKSPLHHKEYWNKKIGRAEHEKIFVKIANYYPEKNHIYLLQGWNLFTQQNKQLKTRLILVGYAPNEMHINKAKAFAFDYKLDNVEFWDSIDDVAGLLSIADAGILTSTHEGSPNIVLEYMHAKIPCVASRINATVEIFGTDYPLFCDLNDAATLAHSLNKSLDQESISEVIENNFSRVNEAYSVSKLQQEYNQLINGK